MPMWKNTDAAGNSVIWAPAYVNKAPTRANANTLYGNTTGNGYITNQTVGMYGVDKSEMRAQRAARAAGRPAHAGWVLKKTGANGRSGRIQTEVLVAMKSITADSENTSYPQYALVIVTNPSSVTINSSSSSNVATFTVTANSIPTGATLTYYWQKQSNSTTWANLTNAGAYSNVSTKTLSVLANTASNGEVYRCGVASANGVVANNIFSTSAVITITT